MTTGNGILGLKPLVMHYFDQTQEDPDMLYKKIANRVQTNDAYEEFANYYELGVVPKKIEGGGMVTDSMDQLFHHRIKIESYALKIIFTREHMQDNKYIPLAQRKVPALKRGCEESKELRFVSILNNAFDSAAATYADGKELCATDHPIVGGTQSNELVTPADLSEASLEQMCIDMRNAKNNRGLRINIRPDKLVLHNDSVFDAHRILKSQLRVGVADNDANALKDMGLVKDICTSNYLTDVDAFWLTTNYNTRPMEGLVYLDRISPMIEDDNVFDTKDAALSVFFRDAFTANNWRCIWGSPGAA